MKKKRILILVTGLSLIWPCISMGYSIFDDPAGDAAGETAADTTGAQASLSTSSNSSSAMGDDDNSPPRTQIYNTVMQNNLSADFTVADYLIRPHLIVNKQFIAGYHGQGGLYDGAFSLRLSDLTWFGSISNLLRTGPVGAAAQVQRIQLGITPNEAFGVGLLYELNSQKVDVAAGTTEQKTVFVGDAYGLFGSLDLEFASFYGNLRRETGTPITNWPKIISDTPDFKQKSSQTIIMVGLIKDSEDEGDNAFGVQVDFATGSSEDDRDVELVEDSFNSLLVTLSHGMPFRLSPDFAVFAGGALKFYRLSFETKLNPNPGVFLGEQTSFYLNLVPNICFRKILGKGFESSMGISANLGNYSRVKQKPTGGEETTVATTSTSLAGGGNLSLGLRWTKQNFAMEGQLNAPVLYQGPDFITGSGTNTAASNLFTAVGITVSF